MPKPKPTGRDALPKRFRPLFDQAQTETAIRYGAQEDALGSILAQASRDYGRQSAAQQTASQSVLGALKAAPGRLTQAYSDAGLTPSLLSQIAGSPTGQRLAGELAAGQAGIQQQFTGAQAGEQYLQQHLFDQYRDDANQVGGQLSSLGKERGLFQSSLLDQLITGDRATRHAANEAARKQQHEDTQAVLDRATRTGNALIRQGITPVINEDGSVTLGPAIPGGKADPNAPGNKPKRTSGPGTATPDAQRTVGNSFSKALALASGMVRGKPRTPEIRSTVQGTLTSGKPASQGKVVYEEVPVLGPNGQPTDKTKRVPKLNKDGSQVTTASRPAIPSFDESVAQAATEQAMFGYVTTATVRKLQKLGYSVNQIPGLKTENQVRRSRPKPDRSTPAPQTRAVTDPTTGQARPT
jgi:hypothetical protein